MDTRKMTAEQRAAWERSRDLNAELREAIADVEHGRWTRKTEFVPLADGRVRRRIAVQHPRIVREVAALPEIMLVEARAKGRFRRSVR